MEKISTPSQILQFRRAFESSLREDVKRSLITYATQFVDNSLALASCRDYFRTVVNDLLDEVLELFKDEVKIEDLPSIKDEEKSQDFPF